MERERDSQLDRLAGKLRDEGIPPERDLWPGIDAAITRRERTGYRRRSPSRWRLAAAAAAVLVLAVGLRAVERVGLSGGADAPAPDAQVVQATETPVITGGMAALDQALDQLEAALAVDPDNLSLSRLVLMVHRTRSELLRKNLTTGLRVG